MIKQIQLRGISRSPSDRVTSDGGLSESLNMYLDSAESAPVFEPDDVTQQIKLPSDLEAEKIFIHKTANYENYIVVQSDKVVAYTPDVDDEEPLLVLELSQGEKVNDIASIGNTLIFSTSALLYYVLYNNRKYEVLGNKIAFPYIHFDVQLQDVEKDVVTSNAFNLDGESEDVNRLWPYDAIPAADLWNEEYNDDHPLPLAAQEFSRRIFNTISNAQSIAERNERLSQIITIRYAVELYDGSTVSSMPIVLSPFYDEFTFAVEQVVTLEQGSVTTQNEFGVQQETVDAKKVTTDTTYPYLSKGYKVVAKLVEGANNIDAWADLITGIKIYVSKPTSALVEDQSSSFIKNVITNTETQQRQEYVGVEYYDTTITKYHNKFDITIGNKRDHGARSLAFNEMLQSSAHAYLYKTIVSRNEDKTITKEFRSLCEGEELDLYTFYKENQKKGEDGMTPMLETLEWLAKDDMKHYPFTSEHLSSYNNSLVLVNTSQTIEYDYDRLNSLVTKKGYPNSAKAQYNLDIIYILQGYKKDMVIRKSFTLNETATEKDFAYAFQVFPDNRAKRMLVKVTRIQSGKESISYGDFKMEAHPYLDCAVTIAPLRRDLISMCYLSALPEFDKLQTYAIDNLDNKLLVSNSDDPFVFPVERRYTFQSKVIGIAVANTALSQGQFGQFPLYVFTEDGIWVMETGADGSFVSQKPLSREVCSNPYSITSIDKAVVFVTKKGVMLIHGAEVINLSEHMNGRHFIPNDDALGLVNKLEGYKQFDDAIKDEDPFMTFMQDARVAYDYPGERLIFMSPSNQDFQYVYKINTKTWHKQSFENIQLITPLNSYPNCLVLGESKVKELWIDTPRSDGEALNYISIIQEVFSRYEVALSEDRCYAFATQDIGIDVSMIDEMNLESLVLDLESVGVFTYISQGSQKVFSLSTILDASRQQTTAKGVIITRPFDLDEPDVYKTIKNVKIRGDFDKGNVKYFLQGSDDGRTFYNLTSLRGKSWKMFRLFILTDLEPTERISWVDIDYEVRFKNRLR